ncbi:hypothetical protein [Paracoccus sp. S-4012]|uniref:hypothetical protein n=1 Tax=Paracoccus sp. S-4012 TaxID=2665648 RepID=UPI001E40B76B|nr:hypothetical protein [Paracoccus sp. S-4012]
MAFELAGEVGTDPTIVFMSARLRLGAVAKRQNASLVKSSSFAMSEASSARISPASFAHRRVDEATLRMRSPDSRRCPSAGIAPARPSAWLSSQILRRLGAS